MTASLARFPFALVHELHLELGRARAVIFALLASLCLALVGVSATPLVAPRMIRSSHPIAPPAMSRPLAVSSDTQSAVVEAKSGAEIDALASSLAKRYRVAAAAIRTVVATAYHEGKNIGLDPLLIVAVMAVESRFNPIAESESGAQGLMQVVPRYHADHVDGGADAATIEPHANIRLGAQVLNDYIRAGGTEVAGLQRYNGSSSDASNAYAAKVLAEKQRLQQAILRAHRLAG